MPFSAVQRYTQYVPHSHGFPKILLERPIVFAAHWQVSWVGGGVILVSGDFK